MYIIHVLPSSRKMELIRILFVAFSITLQTPVYADTPDSTPMKTCQPEDYHYAYTECDSEGGRWRVEVPSTSCVVGTYSATPVRGQSCHFSCSAGEYLNLKSQDCQPCQAGTYSLGGGARYNDWDKLPQGFSVETEKFSSIFDYLGVDEQPNKDVNCTKSRWIPKGDYIASMPSHCSSMLSYSANLVRPGVLTFHYEFEDDDAALFQFTVQNDQCKDLSEELGYEWPPTTKDSPGFISVNLQKGVNLFQWKTLGVGRRTRQTMKKPIKIRDISISGIAYNSECAVCREGTVSSEGSSHCLRCKKDFYAPKGAPQCVKCDTKTQYAPAMSGKCFEKKPCKESDSFVVNTPCSNNQTQVQYKWVEPKICRDDLPSSYKLPEDGPLVSCPPCNPGMQYVDGVCAFCPEGSFGDGSGPCAPCPVNTAPNYGLSINTWSNLPPNINVSTSCLAMNDEGCTNKPSWVTSQDSMRTGQGHADDAFLVFSLKIGGVQGKKQLINGKMAPLAQISFKYQLQCSADCSLFFMQQASGDAMFIETFDSSKKGKQQEYTYDITSPEPVLYSWVFQKTSTADDEEQSTVTYNLVNDLAYIFSVNVTNTVTGGAAVCEPCPVGVNSDGLGCVPCPPGHYIDDNTTTCMRCPENTVAKGSRALGLESCEPCSEGLISKDNVECITDCKYAGMDGSVYDFKELSRPKFVTASRMFTGSGTQYFHLFNISLCGNGDEFPKAQCRNNITTEVDTLIAPSTAKGLICRETILPGNAQGSPPTATQPIVLGDILSNITSKGSIYHKKIEDQLAAMGYPTENADKDVHFTYVSDMMTDACKDGRTILITLRCDMGQKGQGEITMPPKYPDGTSDGCNYYFVWSSRHACPICKEAKYKRIIGQCKAGTQEVYLTAPQDCILAGGKDTIVKTQPCKVLPFYVEVTIIAIVSIGLILCAIVMYCWKKNKKLEYKYHKLVGKPGKHGEEPELPAAETCALSDDEEEDEEAEEVKFKKPGSGSKLVKKLKSIGKKDDYFENVALSEKMPLS